MDPPKEVKEGLAEAGLDAGAFVTFKHGETRVFDLLRTSGTRFSPWILLC
jgi:hypothetical protein